VLLVCFIVLFANIADSLPLGCLFLGSVVSLLFLLLRLLDQLIIKCSVISLAKTIVLAHFLVQLVLINGFLQLALHVFSFVL